MHVRIHIMLSTLYHVVRFRGRLLLGWYELAKICHCGEILRVVGFWGVARFRGNRVCEITAWLHVHSIIVHTYINFTCTKIYIIMLTPVYSLSHHALLHSYESNLKLIMHNCTDLQAQWSGVNPLLSLQFGSTWCSSMRVLIISRNPHLYIPSAQLTST